MELGAAVALPTAKSFTAGQGRRPRLFVTTPTLGLARVRFFEDNPRRVYNQSTSASDKAMRRSMKAKRTNGIDVPGAAVGELEAFLRESGAAGDFMAHRARYLSDARLVRKHVGPGVLLEVGSAPCHMTAILTTCGVKVTGVDLDPERCRWLIERHGLDVRPCDIERQPLPFAEGAFRHVLFAETLEHLRVDPLFALSEINRVLEQGGTLLLTTPNFYSAQNIARFLLGRGITDAYEEYSKLRRIGHMGHVREYTARELHRLLRASGFEVVSLAFKHYNYRGGRRGMAARVAFAILPRRFRSYQVVVARKVTSSPLLAPLD